MYICIYIYICIYKYIYIYTHIFFYTTYAARHLYVLVFFSAKKTRRFLGVLTKEVLFDICAGEEYSEYTENERAETDVCRTPPFCPPPLFLVLYLSYHTAHTTTAERRAKKLSFSACSRRPYRGSSFRTSFRRRVLGVGAKALRPNGAWREDRSRRGDFIWGS